MPLIPLLEVIVDMLPMLFIDIAAFGEPAGYAGFGDIIAVLAISTSIHFYFTEKQTGNTKMHLVYFTLRQNSALYNTVCKLEELTKIHVCSRG